jgi:hypothetical protein
MQFCKHEVVHREKALEGQVGGVTTPHSQEDRKPEATAHCGCRLQRQRIASPCAVQDGPRKPHSCNFVCSEFLLVLVHAFFFKSVRICCYLNFAFKRNDCFTFLKSIHEELLWDLSAGESH